MGHKSLFVLLGITCLAVFSLVFIENTSANNSIVADFNSVYGNDLATKFSCTICHEGGSFSLNDYGKDLSDAWGFSCPQFNAPGTHKIAESKGDCVAYHAAGYKTPLASNCTGCHGKNLRGGSAPSCYLCHGKEWQSTALNQCPDFSPPASHNRNESEDGCRAAHAPGYESPFSSGCTSCHGSNLRGGTGPSCYTCHGDEWNEDDDAPPALVNAVDTRAISASIFRKIESLDSDGDGYSNLEEIKALTNPGDQSSYPQGEISAELSLPTTWPSDWLMEKSTVEIVLTLSNGHQVDSNSALKLIADKVTLTITDFKQNQDGTISIKVPSAFLASLINGNNKISFSLSGTTSLGADFSAETKVKSSVGDLNVEDNFKLKPKPRKLTADSDLTVIVKGKNVDSLDTSTKLQVVGHKKVLKMNATSISSNKITVTLTAKQVEKLFGTISEDGKYQLSVVGLGTGSNQVLLASRVLKATASSGGGGGDTCLDYSPPANHTIARSSGNCTYKHAPGMATPMSSGCNSCHGSNLEGSSFAPSCTECHTKLW